MIFKAKKINKCVGCGLCNAVFGDKVELKVDEKGFIRPYFREEINQELLNDICPLTINSMHYSPNIWGKYEDVFLGASTDNVIHTNGSSGGIITQILVYLLGKGDIDGVIHIGPSTENPLENITCLSLTKEEIINNAGSRYAPASPLSNLNFYLEMDKIFAFVGKPCDVRALRNYSKINSKINEKIKYVLSFFCMGTPSYFGTEKLIEELGLNKNEIKKLRYRGNGWPGFATAIDTKDIKKSMTYNESWGKILGRCIQPYCRWCADGTGEFADISCGDAWYLDENKKPIFDESDGRSLIIARNLHGYNLIKEINQQRCIEISEFSKDMSTLKEMQFSQHRRKATMLGKILALKLVRKDCPYYKFSDLLKWSKNISLLDNIRVFFGTLVRGFQGKI